MLEALISPLAIQDRTFESAVGNRLEREPCNPPDRDPAMTRVSVCVTVLFLLGCAPGTDVVYGSRIRPGGGLPSITTMAVGRVGAQPAPAPPAAAASAASSPDRQRRATAPTVVLPIGGPRD